MKFEEIFKEKGLYKADGFVKGYCYEVDENGWLSARQYKDKDDLLPKKEHPFVYRGLFEKDFVKVFTRQSLFD